MSDFRGPMLLSMKVALVATALVALIGVPLAYAMARRRFWGKSLVDALLIVPLVLPPTVVGYLILIAMGSRSPIGSLLRQMFDYTILFNWHGAVIAAAVVSLPLLYLPARAAFASIDPEMHDLSRLMGATALQTFWHVSLPLARRGIASGLLLAFARALGELGATVMLMGIFPTRQTLPISIFDEYVGGTPENALPAVVALSVISLIVVFFYNRTLRTSPPR